MKNYWLYTYIIQGIAVLMIFGSLVLPWHDAIGAGWQVYAHALTVEAGLMFIDPEGEVVLSLSVWLGIWLVPMTCVIFGVRAVNGYMFTTLEGQQPLVIFLRLLLVSSLLVTYLLLEDGIRAGFWSFMISNLVLIAALELELNLPKKTPEERWLASLPPNHPERIKRGYFKRCPSCRAYNDPSAKMCIQCGFILYTFK